MKHTLKITAILLAMFVVTQLIGIYVVNYYAPVEKTLPFGLDPPQPEQQSDYNILLSSIIFAFIFAVILLFLFTRFRLKFILKAWFLVVIVLALSVSLLTIPMINTILIALIIAIPLAIIKVFGKNFIVHNLTELLIYPGIAAIFV